MKRVLILATLVLASLSSIAQNLDREKEKVTYSQLPLTPLPEELTQYWQNIDLGYIYRADSKTEVTNTIKNAAVISHLEKTSQDGLQILARLETYYRGSTNFKTEVKTTKKDDKEIKTTYHYLTFEYKYPLYYEVILPGEVDPIASGFSNNSSEMLTYTSKSTKSRGELSKWWSDNSGSIQANLRRELLNKNVSELNALLEKNYSYREYSIYTTFLKVKKFKKFDYSDLDEAVNLAIEAQKTIQPTDVLFGEEFNTKMNAAIEIWYTALEESDLEERKTRINDKVTEAIYDNIYLAYGMMNQFDKAAEVKATAEELLGKNPISNFHENWISARKLRFEENAGRIPETVQ